MTTEQLLMTLVLYHQKYNSPQKLKEFCILAWNAYPKQMEEIQEDLLIECESRGIKLFS